jgi:hypothetical protein
MGRREPGPWPWERTAKGNHLVGIEVLFKTTTKTQIVSYMNIIEAESLKRSVRHQRGEVAS